MLWNVDGACEFTNEYQDQVGFVLEHLGIKKV